MTTTLPPAGPDAYGTDPGDPIRARTIGGVGELLSPEEITRSVRKAFSTHISYLEAAVRRVLSIMPTKYEDIWTAAKCFYKLEPIVADGGELVIYASRITRVSVMHPKIAEIGYVVPHAGEVFYRLRPGQGGSPGEPDGRAPSMAGWDG